VEGLRRYFLDYLFIIYQIIHGSAFGRMDKSFLKVLK